IGSGVGLSIVFKALAAGLRVALVDKGNVGGTCLNVGCKPSKMLIYPADRIREIEEAKKLGIHAKIDHIDFSSIMERMKKAVREGQNYIKKEIEKSKNLDFYSHEAHFVEEYTLEIMNEKIRGGKIFIVSGARPLIPPTKGLDKIAYLTNETVLELKRRPESMIIIGGGYIGAEYGHFFAAIGTKVAIVGRNERLVPNEEPEISDLLRKTMEQQMEIHTGTEVLDVTQSSDSYAVLVKNKKTGEEKQMKAEKIMVAVGRKSNADPLEVRNTRVETTEAGFIKVNDYLQTTKENIWALGDAIGKQMFTHAGDKEAGLAWHNATQEKKMKMDFRIVPHAIFTYPQIASVGLTEVQARKEYGILVGRAKYSDIVKGEAMMEEESFAKAIVEKDTKKILGFHIIGPEASTLIQEVVNAIANEGNIESITNSMHIFPALSELITETLSNLE
ncbi:MAG: dihydrolipoyl dehydrogenase, partial [Thermodesulfobacteriota bacterium]